MPDLTARRNTFHAASSSRARPVPDTIPIRADPSTATTHDEKFLFSAATVFCRSGRESHVMFFLERAWVQLALHVLGSDRFTQTRRGVIVGKVDGRGEFWGAI